MTKTIITRKTLDMEMIPDSEVPERLEQTNYSVVTVSSTLEAPFGGDLGTGTLLYLCTKQSGMKFHNYILNIDVLSINPILCLPV